MPAANELSLIDAGPIEAGEFAALLADLGPFEPAPRLAVAVSGGGDSLALALLADCWARAQGGSILALIVDHGLRAGSAAEAASTADRLRAIGCEAIVLQVTDLQPGPGLAERARLARYQILTRACLAAGIVHLLLGHHLADQAETLLIRRLGGSGAAGLAAMAALIETHELRLLRPLLSLPPSRLRAHLRAAGMGWIEDPSNRDIRALRPRLRGLRADRDGTGSATLALAAAAASHGRARALGETRSAAILAGSVGLYAEGFAVLPRGKIAPQVLAALVRAIAGARYPADGAALAALAGTPRPATLGGVRLIESRGSLVMLREEAAIAPPVAAIPGAVWDGRFRIGAIGRAAGAAPAASVLGKLGDAAADFRHRSALPSAVLRTLPALRIGEKLVAVPHLGYYAEAMPAAIEVRFAPPRPAAPSVFAVQCVRRAACLPGDARGDKAPYLIIGLSE